MEPKGLFFLTSPLFFFAFFISSTMASLPSLHDHAHDGATLLSFKSLLRYSNSEIQPLKSWNESVHYCQWTGVQCRDRRNSARVTSLNLSSSALVGPISPSLSNLPSLEQLNLRNNSFHGRIPSELGNLTHLKTLDLSNNNLDGDIPTELGNLSRLTVLSLGLNNLTGEIPSPLFNLSSLTVFHVGRNQLSGTLPSDFGLTLPNLIALLMYENKFEGPIPLSLTNATSLQSIQLCSNFLTGLVPPNFGVMPNLSMLDLGGNKLVAKEPSDWSFLASLSNCRNLKVLNLRSNKLGGILPDSISNLSTSLEKLNLWGNQITGTIPQGIGNLVNLSTLLLGENLLTGQIPHTVGKLQRLQNLGLDNNKLVGEIPPSIGNLRQLNELCLCSNHLAGSIPASLGNCKNLVMLNLSHNSLSGPIPKEVVGLSSLSMALDLSYNSLTGSLPSEVGYLRNLQTLDISNNKISGTIPESFSQYMILEYLFMQGNSIQGEIPSSFIFLKGVVEMDLSRNSLSGQIPEFLGKLSSLAYLNISFNQFDGRVPNGTVFRNSSEFFAAENRGLCGGIPSLKLPQCPNVPARKNRSPLIFVSIIVIPVAACHIVLVFFIMRYRLRAKGIKKTTPSLPSMKQHEKVSYNELHKASNGFSKENLVGKGAFGSVYKGILKKKVVAIKVLDLKQHGATKSFLQECEVLKNIRHHNLVKVITSCSSSDYTGNDFKALVYDFKQNGCLDKWLHTEASEVSQVGRLDLTQRLNIAIDVASGLVYLHHYGQIPIVHCDLKPNNVLLDYDMTAHVSDFGLAKLLLTGDDNVGNATQSIGIKGSIGYIPPEYGMGGHISTQGDVYSYGILLLEMFTGRRPTDHTFQNGLSLGKYIEMAFSDQVTSIIDPYLLFQDEEKEGNENISEKIHECLKSVIGIGLLCSKESPGERMEMKDVTRAMHMIRDTFLGIGVHSEDKREAPLESIVVQA